MDTYHTYDSVLGSSAIIHLHLYTTNGFEWERMEDLQVTINNQHK